jgi:carbon-monoxide dehydrogenase small subunit
VSERVVVDFTANDQPTQVFVEPRKTLADTLPEDVGLTGTHIGCEHGVCGACTVLVNEEAIRSCLMFAIQTRGAEIVTVEGLEHEGQLHPVQQAFRDSHSFQCGFCTPGFVMSVVALLREATSPSEAEIREALSGNICRCTGYQSIVAGVQLAAERLTGARASVAVGD